VLRFRPGWKGVDVVSWLEDARWRLGVWAESNNLERSLVVGVEKLFVGGDLIVTTFLIGELCRAPEGLLVLFDVFRQEGREEVLLQGRVGVELPELGLLVVGPEVS